MNLKKVFIRQEYNIWNFWSNLETFFEWFHMYTQESFNKFSSNFSVHFKSVWENDQLPCSMRGGSNTLGSMLVLKEFTHLYALYTIHTYRVNIYCILTLDLFVLHAALWPSYVLLFGLERQLVQTSPSSAVVLALQLTFVHTHTHTNTRNHCTCVWECLCLLGSPFCMI